MVRNWRLALDAAKEWRKDRSFRLRLVNIGHLLSGNLVSGLVSFAAIALTARAVGPDSYGILALAITYARAIERLVTFQSWQPLIKYGAEVNTPEHHDDFKRLLKFGLLLDAVGALAAWLVAITVAFAASPLLGWDSRVTTLIMVYRSEEHTTELQSLMSKS